MKELFKLFHILIMENILKGVIIILGTIFLISVLNFFNVLTLWTFLILIGTILVLIARDNTNLHES
jgi:hypothetical protein